MFNVYAQYINGIPCTFAVFDLAYVNDNCLFMPPPFEEWWRGIKCKIKIWCPLNNFWKTASIQFKFGMLIYNFKTQVEFDLGYNPLLFDRVMDLL